MAWTRPLFSCLCSPGVNPHPSEEKESAEGLYLRMETRKRVQTNEAKSKRRRASPTKITGPWDNTPASEEEEEEGLYLRIGTRKRVQTNERSPNAVARRRPKPQVDGTTPRPPDACLPAECCWVGKVTVSLSPPKAYRGGGRIPKDGLARATNPNSGLSEPCTPVGVGWNTHGTPKDVPPDWPKKSRVSNPTP